MIIADWRGKIPKTCRVYLIGDTHIGRIGVAHHKIETAVEMIKKDKNAYAVAMGDMIEAIHVGDIRYNPLEQEGKYATADDQCRDAAEHFKPIAKKTLAWLVGNHEEKIDKVIDAAQVCIDHIGVNIPHGGRTAKILLSDNLKIFCTHGAGSTRSTAGDPHQIEDNESRAIKRKLRLLQGDCQVMAMGHIHKLRIYDPVKRLAIVGNSELKQLYIDETRGDRGYIGEDYRYYCSTGSFVGGYQMGVTTYVEKAMYPPTELGMIRVDIEKDRIKTVEKVIL